MSVNIFDLVDTWNDPAVNFRAIKMNVIDTSSGAGSALMELLVGGGNKFRVSRTGGIELSDPGHRNIFDCSQAATDVHNAFNKYGSGHSSGSILDVRHLGGSVGSPAAPVTGTHITSLSFRTGGTNGLLFAVPSFAIRHTIGSVIGSVVSGVDTSLCTTNTGNGDLRQGLTINGQDTWIRIHHGLIVGESGSEFFLTHDGAQLAAVRNGTSAQTFRIYNTFTNSSNHERGTIGWSSHTLRIGTESAGTGVARPLSLVTGGVEQVQLGANGNVGIGAAASTEKLRLTFAAASQSGFVFNTAGALNPSFNFISASANASRTGSNPVTGVSVNLNEANINTIGRVTSIVGSVNAGLSLDNRGGIIGVYGSAGLTLPHTVGHSYGVVGSSSDQNTNAFGVVATLNSPGNYSGKAALLAASSADGDVAHFRTSSGEAMRIAASGNVGIGTTAPGALLDLATTWNNGATTFRGIRLNVTNTASGVGSLLMDLQTGGATRLSLTPSGQLNLASALQFVGNAQIGSTGNNDFYTTANQFRMGGAGDVFLCRDAANILGIRNGANPQAFRVYNTYTDGSNYERGAVTWAGNSLFISTERSGAGIARSLVFTTDEKERLRIAADGRLTYTVESTVEPGDIAAQLEFYENGGGSGEFIVTVSDFSGDGFPTAHMSISSETGISLSHPFIDLNTPGGNSVVSGWTVASTFMRPSNASTTLGTTATGAYYPIDTANINNIFLHNSYTNSTNWERGHVRWVSNALELSTERNGSGVARPIIFRTNTINRLQIGAAGALIVNLGASQNFTINGLPTANPNVAGALWNDGGTLKVSAG